MRGPSFNDMSLRIFGIGNSRRSASRSSISGSVSVMPRSRSWISYAAARSSPTLGTVWIPLVGLLRHRSIGDKRSLLSPSSGWLLATKVADSRPMPKHFTTLAIRCRSSNSYNHSTANEAAAAAASFAVDACCQAVYLTCTAWADLRRGALTRKLISDAWPPGIAVAKLWQAVQLYGP